MSGTVATPMKSRGSLRAQRGEVWWADLDPTKGRELGRKIRPVLIVSADVMNQGEFERVIVVPSTTANHDIPCHVPFTRRTSQGALTSYFCCEDVRSISIERLMKKAGDQLLPTRIMGQVEEWLRTLMAL
jgi:mRNA interferase MazF